jgi:ABC-type taurine transport system ATPase subunit
VSVDFQEGARTAVALLKMHRDGGTQQEINALLLGIEPDQLMVILGHTAKLAHMALNVVASFVDPEAPERLFNEYRKREGGA